MIKFYYSYNFLTQIKINLDIKQLKGIIRVFLKNTLLIEKEKKLNKLTYKTNLLY